MAGIANYFSASYGTLRCYGCCTSRTSCRSLRFVEKSKISSGTPSSSRWLLCCSVAFKTTFVASAHGISMHMVYIPLSEMIVKPNTQDFEEDRHHPPHPDWRPRHDARAVSIQHSQIECHTHPSAVSGSNFDGCSYSWI